MYLMKSFMPSMSQFQAIQEDINQIFIGFALRAYFAVGSTDHFPNFLNAVL